MASALNSVLAALVIFRRGDQVWLARRTNTRWGDGMYETPGGHALVDESPHAAAIREMQEEVGVTIKPQDLVLAGMAVFDYLNGKTKELSKCINFYYVVSQWEGEISMQEPDKSTAGQWYDLDALPSPILPHVAEALQAVRSNQFFCNIGTCQQDRSDTMNQSFQPILRLG